MLAFIVGSIFFSACENGKQDTVKIGVILPLTGSSADAANQIKDGIELALDQFVKNSPEVKIELIYGDSKNQAKDGLSEYNRIKSIEGAKFFIASNSGVVAPLVETVKNDKDIIMMTTVNSAMGVPQAGENIYRIFVSVENEAKTMAGFISKELKLQNISLLYINDDFGLSGKKVFNQELELMGFKVLWESSFEKNGIEFANIINKIPGNTEVVYVIGYEKAFGLIIKQLRELGFQKEIVTSIGLSVPSWRAIAGKAAEGVHYTAANFSVDNPSAENKHFIEEFNAKYNKTPSSFSAFGYDAANVLFNGIKYIKIQKGSFNESLTGTDYIGSMGKVIFDKYGEADLPLSIYVYKNEKEIKVK
jgi:branched-chain amino acid transport system substrate-binding protein